MRRIVRSRTYLSQLEVLLDQGAAKFGHAVVAAKLKLIDATLDRLALFPAAKQADPHLGLRLYPVTKTPLVLVYDFNDDELRVHFVLHARADRRMVEPDSAEL